MLLTTQWETDMLIQTFGFALARRAGAFLLVGIILWYVVEHCGSTNGQAIVHVSMPEVDVTVDDATYRVESLRESPIVCELRPGRHTVRMLRYGRTCPFRMLCSPARPEQSEKRACIPRLLASSL